MGRFLSLFYIDSHAQVMATFVKAALFKCSTGCDLQKYKNKIELKSKKNIMQ